MITQCLACHKTVSDCQCIGGPVTQILDSRLPYLNALLKDAYNTPAGIHVNPEELLRAFCSTDLSVFASVEEFTKYIHTRIRVREYCHGYMLSSEYLRQPCLSQASDPDEGFQFVYGYWESLQDVYCQRDMAILEILQYEMPTQERKEWYNYYQLNERLGQTFRAFIDSMSTQYKELRYVPYECILTSECRICEHSECQGNSYRIN